MNSNFINAKEDLIKYVKENHSIIPYFKALSQIDNCVRSL